MSLAVASTSLASRIVREEFLPSGSMPFRELIAEEDSLNTWQLDKAMRISAVSLSRISQVKVYTDYQVICVYDDEHGIYDELSLYDDSFDFSVVSHTPLQQAIGTVALFPHLDPYNYYHWLIDTMPCLGVLDMAGISRGSIDHLYIHRMHSRFQRRHLKQLGIDPDTVISRDHCVQHFSVEDLLVPYFRLDGADWPNAWAFDYLKEKWLTESKGNNVVSIAPTAVRAKLYIARGKARREVSNEAELMERLSSLGYTIVEPHKMTIEEQAVIFANAEYILASHGAGLANLVFCKPDTQVLEFGGHYITCHFRVVANLAKLHYRSIAGGADEQGGHLNAGYEGEHRDSNFIADIDHIVKKAKAYFGC